MYRFFVLGWIALVTQSYVTATIPEYIEIEARVVCDTVNFASNPRHYYLYDLFDHDPSMPHHAMPEGRAKQVFCKLDHGAIYLFIAGRRHTAWSYGV